jgi:vacuolar-type H+-ATPase subunit I/STV1
MMKMKSKLPGILAVVVSIIFCVCICGCEEQSLTPDSKKARLVASENIELKKQLEQCRQDLAKEKELREKEVQEAKAQVEKYQEQIRKLQGQSTAYLQQQIESFVGALVEETAKLKAENDLLKERIKELEK